MVSMIARFILVYLQTFLHSWRHFLGLLHKVSVFRSLDITDRQSLPLVAVDNRNPRQLVRHIEGVRRISALCTSSEKVESGAVR